MVGMMLLWQVLKNNPNLTQTLIPIVSCCYAINMPAFPEVNIQNEQMMPTVMDMSDFLCFEG